MTTSPDDTEPPVSDGLSQFTRPGRRVTLSVLSGAGSTVIVSGLAALATRLITIHVGPTNYGLFVTALTFVTTVMLFTDLGISAITGRDIARSPNDAAEILGHNLGLRLTLSVLLIPILALVGITLYPAPSVRWSILLITLSIPFNALQAISLGYYVASIRNYVPAGVGLLQQVMYVAGVAIAISSGFGIVGFATSYLVATTVSGIVSFFIVRRELTFKPLFNVTRWRRVLGSAASLGAIQIINLLYLKADTLLLTKMASSRAVGLYGIAYNFTTFTLFVPSLILMSVMPLLATSSGERFEMLLRRATHSLAVLGVVAVMMTLLFAPQAITILSGHHFLGAATSMRLLGLACYFSFLNTALGFAAVACNRHHRMIIVSAAGLILNVGLNLALIPRFGINGAATATLISEFVALIGVRIVFARDVGTKISLVKISLLPVIVGAGVTVIGRFALLKSWHATIPTLLWAPVILVIFLVVLALVRGLTEEVAFASEKMKSVVKMRKPG